MHSNDFVESLTCVHQIMEYADDVSKVLGLKLHKFAGHVIILDTNIWNCLLYTSPSPRDQRGSRMPSSA